MPITTTITTVASPSARSSAPPVPRGAPELPRSSPGCPTHVYVGDGDPHWAGQPCDVELVNPASGLVAVRFACGCRAAVPPRHLVRRPPQAA